MVLTGAKVWSRAQWRVNGYECEYGRDDDGREARQGGDMMSGEWAGKRGEQPRGRSSDVILGRCVGGRGLTEAVVAGHGRGQ